jgi:hypothetical protein
MIAMYFAMYLVLDLNKKRRNYKSLLMLVGLPQLELSRLAPELACRLTVRLLLVEAELLVLLA